MLTKYKFLEAFIIVFGIVLFFELSARIGKWLFQNPETDLIVHLDQNKDVVEHEPKWTEQDFWYPPELKPMRYGVYKVIAWVPAFGMNEGSFQPRFCVYSCVGWLVPCETIEIATQSIKKFDNQELYWHGVTYEENK